MRESFAAWVWWAASLESARSAALRGVIRALEFALLQWRVWAGAQRKWTRWADELARRHTPLVRRRDERDARQQLLAPPRSADPLTPRQLAPTRRLSELERTLEPPVLTPQNHRAWANSAALRWDVASSGFADELRRANGRASQRSTELRSARQRHSRRLQLALGDTRRVGGGGALSIW